VKLANERAAKYLSLHEVENAALFDEMLEALLGSLDRGQFDARFMLYVLSPEYPRGDISLAAGVVSREHPEWRI